MVEGSILRLFTFRAVRPAFDEILRHQLVPDLSAQAGILDCYSGRQGPDEIGPRVVASVWVSEDAMLEALGAELGQGPFHPELLEETTDRLLEVLPICLAARYDGTSDPAPTILRTLRGRVGQGGLAEYVADVQEGVDADERAGIDPASRAPDRLGRHALRDRAERLGRGHGKGPSGRGCPLASWARGPAG